jgi:tripartite-type tricarboxylate transporter receptor subunit TctC
MIGRIAAAALGVFSLFAAGALCAQQAFPSRPVSFILPVPPGGALDVFARALSSTLHERSGIQLLIENRPGADFLIAANACAKSRPDGYTVCMLLRDNLSIRPAQEKVPYDPYKDFVPVTNMVYLQNVMVAHPSVPAKTFQELVAYSKKNPDKLNYTAFGASQALMEWVKQHSGANMTFIRYKGAGDAFKDFLAGRVQVMYIALSNPGLVNDINTGKMTGLAIPGEKRIRLLPNVPSFSEVGLPKVDFRNWLGLFAPGGTPANIVAKLSTDVSGVLRSPEFIDKYLTPGGFDPIGGTPEEFARFLQEDRKVGEMLAKMGTRLN